MPVLLSNIEPAIIGPIKPGKLPIVFVIPNRIPLNSGLSSLWLLLNPLVVNASNENAMNNNEIIKTGWHPKKPATNIEKAYHVDKLGILVKLSNQWDGNNPGMARPIVVIAFLTVGFGKFILFVKKSATNPTDSVKPTLRIFGIDDIKPAFYSFI